MANYKRPEACPQCGSIFVDWDRYHKVYRCLVRECNWTSEYKNGTNGNKNGEINKVNKISKLEEVTV